MRHSIGIDIGATNIRMAVIDEKGAITRLVSAGTKKTEKPGELASQINELCKGLEYDNGDIVGVGIGIPGPVTPGTGMVSVLPNIGIQNIDIIKELQDVFPFPISVMNDANAAAYCEAMLGEGRDYPVVQFITVSSGVGGGLVIDKKVITGKYGYAQEVGTMIISSFGEKPNPIMSKGSMESLCSARSLERQARREGFAIAHAGEVFTDPKLAKIKEEWIDNMAKGIANMVALYEPDIFILGGGIIKSEKFFMKELTEKVNDYIYPQLREKIIIRTARFGQNAGIVGAGLLPFAFDKSK